TQENIIMDRFCPICKLKVKLNKHGFNRSGSQRYLCRSCGHTETEGGGIQGSLPKYGAKAQTGYDRLKRCRKRKKDNPEK
ncbi:MAG: IS1/IS1595 family N-terminal zinc-binding domain-containing protein, partial [Microcoleus sp.]